MAFRRSPVRSRSGPPSFAHECSEGCPPSPSPSLNVGASHFHWAFPSQADVAESVHTDSFPAAQLLIRYESEMLDLRTIQRSPLGCCLAPAAQMLAKHIVYILRSVSQPHRPYVGLTHDVDARLDAHNAGRCTHTARYRPWSLVAAIVLADERTAIRFERYLNSGSGRAFAKRHFEQ